MALQTSQLRLIAPTAFTSLVLLAVSATAAIYLYLQQTGTAEELRENIGSRQAASNLEETLQDLVAYHRKGDEHVEPLHEKIVQRLAEIDAYADKPQEKQLAAELQQGYEHYLKAWESNADAAARAAAARTVLEREVLPLCQDLRKFNAKQIDTSEQLHRQTLRWMAWGLAGVSGAGALAGLVLGYGVARGLRRSIHQLRVRVQDAADKLGRDLPAVEMTGESLEELDSHLQGVIHQVEQVVQTLQQREREVLRAEQLAAVGRLAAGVAHEIRNPLTSIKMLIQTAREGASLPSPGFAGEGPGVRGLLAVENKQPPSPPSPLPQSRERGESAIALPSEDASVIEQEVRRIERSLQSFLDFARPPKLRRTATDLRSLAEPVVNLVRGRAAKQGVEIHIDQPPAPVVSEVDADQLRQVLLNLLLNALDAMPAGGSVCLRLRPPENGRAELSVADTGPGIADDIRPRLFTPFVSDKETGMGLGLSVSRRIVEDHGGTLTAANRPVGGACFVVKLPAR